MKLVSLKNLPIEPVSHNPEIKKQVLVKKGQIPFIAQIAKTTFKIGQIAPSHIHQDMYEVFIVEQGSGKAILDNREIQLEQGTILTVEPGEAHEIVNNSKNLLVLTIIGVEVI